MPFSLHIILASLIGISPVFLWLLFFLWQDIRKPEPLRWLGISFLTGMMITPIVWEIENQLVLFFHINLSHSLPFVTAAIVYLGIAVIEELAKFLSAFLILRKNRYFDEAIDAMIYLIVVALGFGFVENFLIAYQQLGMSHSFLPLFQITSLRFMGANLLHALCSGIIGFFWAISLIKKRKRYLFIGLILGILLHWVFNLAIITIGGEAVFLVTLILFLCAVFILWAFDILKHFRQPFSFTTHHSNHQ